MKLLITANGYPTSKNPTRQIFVKKIYEKINEDLVCRLGNNREVNVDILHNKYYTIFKEGQDEGNLFSRIIKITLLIFSYMPYIIYKIRDYDIVYAHGVLYSASLMCLGARLHRKKIVCYVHGGDVNACSRNRGVFYKIIRKTLACCDLVITNSYYQRDRLRKEYQSESLVISPGYNEAVYFYSPSLKTTDILFAGNAIKRKGIDILLKTIGDHRQYYSKNSVSVKIHCSGLLKDEYIRIAEKLKLTEIITFGDRLEEEELAMAYRDSRIFVFPSREEPLGMVGIEAIASGTVLIASNTGGIKEYVKSGCNGFLFEKEDSEELHHLITHVLESYPEFEERLEMSSKTVAGYSLQSGIDETLKHLAKLHSNGFK